MSVTDLILSYLEAWNGRDSAARRTLMKPVLTEDSVYSDPGHAGLTGYDFVECTGNRIRTVVGFLA